jgi:hypothetical protein
VLPESVSVLMLVVKVFESLRIPLDLDYMRQWATDLAVVDLLQRALKESE